MDKIKVDILLSTYNGEKYISELLDSLFTQSMGEFRILVRDDGSLDRTLDILTSFQRSYPSKLSIINDGLNHLGAKTNFSELIQHSSAPYVMLCDQDDVWLSHKIADSLAAIQELEDTAPESFPALVHTDLEVVDERLNQIDSSFFHYAGLDPKRDYFNQLLVQNIVTGCTTIMNRSLVDLAAPIPPEARMHDWWIALAASSMGKIGFLPKSTVKYRQHGENTIGASRFNAAYIYRKASEIKPNQRGSILDKNFIQAQVFQKKYSSFLSENESNLLNQFIDIQRQNFFQKRTTLLRYGFLKGKISQTIGLLLFI